MKRCGWAGSDPLYIKYHDQEWGVPLHDDRLLFEFLILEGAQAGLSWLTILRKRENYREALDQFNPELIAQYGDFEVNKLMQNSGIIRNRRKILAIIQNAKSFLNIQEEFGSFDNYIWKFVDGRPKQNHRSTLSDVPANTEESDKMSKALKEKGFCFVGSTICYAFMQAVGMVNDHVENCFRYKELSN